MTRSGSCGLCAEQARPELSGQPGKSGPSRRSGQNADVLDPLVAACLEATGPVLCLDIGSGTQDALLALPDQQPENWPKFVLPAPARQVATRLRELTAARRPVWLYGQTMGGGFGGAVRAHLEAGLALAATTEAAASLHDDPARVEAMGVRLSAVRPEAADGREYVPLHLADFAPAFWDGWGDWAGLPRPELTLVAAQDHGVHPDLGNREGRFQIWRDLLTRSQGDPSAWLYAAPPSRLTRLNALQRATGGLVADTGTAAVLGALAAPEVRARSHRQGIRVINVGNSHVVAFLVYQERVYGIYEHHTGLHDAASLEHDLREFGFGWLPDEEVRAKGGHGTVYLPLPEEAEGFAPAYVVGPRRELLRGQGQFIAPHGDMMVAGCHGLLRGFALRRASSL